MRTEPEDIKDATGRLIWKRYDYPDIGKAVFEHYEKGCYLYLSFPEHPFSPPLVITLLKRKERYSL